MSYIQKSLGDGETIIARARFPFLYVAAAWLSLLIPSGLLLAALANAQTQPDPYSIAAGLLFVLRKRLPSAEQTEKELRQLWQAAEPQILDWLKKQMRK